MPSGGKLCCDCEALQCRGEFPSSSQADCHSCQTPSGYTDITLCSQNTRANTRLPKSSSYRLRSTYCKCDVEGDCCTRMNFEFMALLSLLAFRHESFHTLKWMYYL